MEFKPPSSYWKVFKETCLGKSLGSGPNLLATGSFRDIVDSGLAEYLDGFLEGRGFLLVGGLDDADESALLPLLLLLLLGVVIGFGYVGKGRRGGFPPEENEEGRRGFVKIPPPRPPLYKFETGYERL